MEPSPILKMTLAFPQLSTKHTHHPFSSDKQTSTLGEKQKKSTLSEIQFIRIHATYLYLKIDRIINHTFMYREFVDLIDSSLVRAQIVLYFMQLFLSHFYDISDIHQNVSS